MRQNWRGGSKISEPINGRTININLGYWGHLFEKKNIK